MQVCILLSTFHLSTHVHTSKKKHNSVCTFLVLKFVLDISFKSDATEDDLIDIIEGNRIYIPCIYVLNKIDQISIEELDIVYRIPHSIPISAHHGWNFDDLLEKVVFSLFPHIHNTFLDAVHLLTYLNSRAGFRCGNT
jgi:predicted GTPase